MKILAIESSAKAASVALCDSGVLIGQYFMNAGLTHSATLLKMAEDLLSHLNLTVNQLDAVAVANGPGSFTGIRIGVSAAIGLSWGARYRYAAYRHSRRWPVRSKSLPPSSALLWTHVGSRSIRRRLNTQTVLSSG